MKRILTIILAALLAFSMTACGGKADAKSSVSSGIPSSAPSSAETDAADDDDAEDEGPAEDGTTMSEEEYEAGSREFIAAFEELVPLVIQMTENFDDSEGWYTTYAEIYTQIGNFSEQLAEMTAEVPEAYQESHIQITVAVAAFADMMDAVGNATTAYKSGDTAKGDELMANAKELLDAADQLWSEAVVAG